jgi:hypothetical protein
VRRDARNFIDAPATAEVDCMSRISIAALTGSLLVALGVVGCGPSGSSPAAGASGTVAASPAVTGTRPGGSSAGAQATSGSSSSAAGTGTGTSAESSAAGAGTSGGPSASVPGTSGGPYGGSSGGPPSTEYAGTPSAEQSGPESPGPTQPVEASITVPQLPIGGGAYDESVVEQCVAVSYLGRTPIPAGARITVGRPTFTPSFFELGGSGCVGRFAPCLSAGFAFTADNVQSGSGRCDLPVRAIGGQSLDSVDLSLAGVVICPVGQDAVCQSFEVQAAADDQTIALAVPDWSTFGSASSSSAPSSSAPSSSAPSSSSSASSSSASSASAGASDTSSSSPPP